MSMQMVSVDALQENTNQDLMNVLHVLLITVLSAQIMEQSAQNAKQHICCKETNVPVFHLKAHLMEVDAHLVLILIVRFVKILLLMYALNVQET